MAEITAKWNEKDPSLAIRNNRIYVYTKTPVEKKIPLQLTFSRSLGQANFTSVNFDLYLRLPENSAPSFSSGLELNNTVYELDEYD